MPDMAKKVALITGGGTGVGRSVTLQLAERGFDVAINYSRSEDDAESTANEAREHGVRAIDRGLRFGEHGLPLMGCGDGAVAPPQSDAQDRVAKLMNLYRYYDDKQRKPPPNEEALRDFGAKLTPEERSARMIGHGW